MTESRLLVSWGLLVGGMVTVKGQEEAFWGDGNLLHLDHTGVFICQNSALYLEQVQCFVCKLYFSQIDQTKSQLLACDGDYYTFFFFFFVKCSTHHSFNHYDSGLAHYSAVPSHRFSG